VIFPSNLGSLGSCRRGEDARLSWWWTQSNSTSGVLECLGWGPGAGVGCPWAAASSSHVGCIIPLCRCLSLDALSRALYVLANWRWWTGCRWRLECQGPSGALSVTISLEELHASSSRTPEQCCSKKVEDVSKGRHTPRILHASKFTIQSTLLAKVHCGSRSSHNLMRHVARSALLHARQTRISHPKIDTPPPERLSFDTVLQSEATADTCAYVQC
jgi:hypothetical protein